MDKNIIAQLLQDYDQFTKSEKKIVDYVLAHQNETQYISITDLSAACQVAVATISVFCKKLKLAGFNDFKLELAKAGIAKATQFSMNTSLDTIQRDDSAATVMEKTLSASHDALNLGYQLLKDVDVRRASRIIDEARTVTCLGQGNSSTVALAAWTQFATVTSKFRTIQDSHLQIVALSTINEEDAVIYFSYSGATFEVIHAAQLVKSKGAKLILVTRYANAPAAEYADVVLLCGPNEEPLEFGSIVAMISQLYVVDVLIGQYYKHHREQVEENRAIVGKELSRKQM